MRGLESLSIFSVIHERERFHIQLTDRLMVGCIHVGDAVKLSIDSDVLKAVNGQGSSPKKRASSQQNDSSDTAKFVEVV